MNAAHPIDRLPALLLGDDDGGLDEIDEHVAACDECAAELASLREVMGRLPVALPRAEARGEDRRRLLGSVEHLERFAVRATALGALFDLDTNDARLCLHALSDDRDWKAAPVPGVTWRPVAVGPRRHPGKGVLARLSPGATFPHHRHGGDEHLLVLSGELVEGDDTLRPGSMIVRETGTSHAISASATGPGCVCALLNLGPIEITHA